MAEEKKQPSKNASTEDALDKDPSTASAVTKDSSNERTGTGFFAVMQSVGAAMIGVQSSKNKERDFTHGKPLHFIIGGLVGTGLFLLVIWLLVKYLIATS